MYLTEETKKAFEKWMAWDITSVHPNTTKEFNKFIIGITDKGTVNASNKVSVLTPSLQTLIIDADDIFTKISARTKLTIIPNK